MTSVETTNSGNDKDTTEASGAAARHHSDCDIASDATKMDDVDTVKHGKDTWRCPDPGCKFSNEKGDLACRQCKLPKHSAHQFKRNQRGQPFRGGGGGGGWGRGGGGGGGGRGGGWKDRGQRGGRGQGRLGARAAVPKGVDPNSPVIIQFQQYAKQLDYQHDKHERLVKLSRDITIESKRTIFLLHRITCERDKPTVLLEAEKKLADIRHDLWYHVAVLLRAEKDHFKYLRAYTGGLQEYVEALSFYKYNCSGRLITWKEVQDELKFNYRIWTPGRDDAEKSAAAASGPSPTGGEQSEEVVSPGDEDKENAEVAKEGVDEIDEEHTKVKESKPLSSDCADTAMEASSPEDPKKPTHEEIIVTVPQTEFFLGLADLTGEVMRQAINMVGMGDVDACFELADFLHALNDGFATVDTHAHKEMGRKIRVLRQSIAKVEKACYAISIRGREMPKHLMASYLTSVDMDDSFLEADSVDNASFFSE